MIPSLDVTISERWLRSLGSQSARERLDGYCAKLAVRCSRSWLLANVVSGPVLRPELLVELGTNDREALLTCLRKTKDALTRARLARALGSFETHESIVAELEKLAADSSEDEMVRDGAKKALDWICA